LVRADALDFYAVTTALLDATWYAKPAGGAIGAIQRQTNVQVVHGLLRLALDTSIDDQVRAVALHTLGSLDHWLSRQSPRDVTLRAHYGFVRFEIERLRRDPTQLEFVMPVTVPPGSPIGSFQIDSY
jgi:hypothetical protein